MKKNIFKLITAVLFIFAINFSAGAKESESYNAVLKELLEVSGTAGTLSTYMDTYKSLLGMDDEVWNLVSKKIESSFIKNMVELYEPIYKNHYTIDDLHEMIKFYKSPIGKKIVKETPAITAESLKLGSELGMKLMEDLEEELTELGYF